MAAALPPSSFPSLPPPDPSRFYRAVVADAKRQFTAVYRSCQDSLAATKAEIPKWEARRAEFENQPPPERDALERELSPKLAFYASHRAVRDQAQAIATTFEEVSFPLLSHDGEASFVHTLLTLQNLQAIDLGNAKAAFDHIFTVQAKILDTQKRLMQVRHKALKRQVLQLKLALEPLYKASSADPRPALPAAVNAAMGRAPYVDAELSQLPAAAAPAAASPLRPPLPARPPLSASTSPQRPASAPSRAAGAAAPEELEDAESCFPAVEPPNPARFFDRRIERLNVLYAKYGFYSGIKGKLDALTVTQEDYSAKRDEYIGHKKMLEEIRRLIREYKKTLEDLMPGDRPPLLDSDTLLLLQNLEVIVLENTKSLYDAIFIIGMSQLQAQKKALDELEPQIEASLKAAAAKLEPWAPRVERQSSVSSFAGWLWSRGEGTPCLDADVRIREMEMTALSS